MGGKKQIVQVLDAVQAGCETSHEIEAYTGIDRAACAAWLSELKAAGAVIVTRPACRTSRFIRYKAAANA